MTESTGGTEEPLPNYLAYLLRMWRVQGEGADAWRASLRSPGSDERHGFSGLDDLFLFLRRQTGAGPEADDDKNGAQ